MLDNTDSLELPEIIGVLAGGILMHYFLLLISIVPIIILLIIFVKHFNNGKGYGSLSEKSVRVGKRIGYFLLIIGIIMFCFDLSTLSFALEVNRNSWYLHKFIYQDIFFIIAFGILPIRFFRNKYNIEFNFPSACGGVY